MVGTERTLKNGRIPKCPRFALHDSRLMRQPAGDDFHHQTAQGPYIHLEGRNFQRLSMSMKFFTSDTSDTSMMNDCHDVTRCHPIKNIFWHLLSDLAPRVKEFGSHVPHAAKAAKAFFPVKETPNRLQSLACSMACRKKHAINLINIYSLSDALPNNDIEETPQTSQGKL